VRAAAAAASGALQEAAGCVPARAWDAEVLGLPGWPDCGRSAGGLPAFLGGVSDCAKYTQAAVSNREAECGAHAVRTDSSWTANHVSMTSLTLQVQPDHPPRALTSILPQILSWQTYHPEHA